MNSSNKLIRDMKNALRNHSVISGFRSALFFASFMVILEHHGLLEWLDVFMLRVVSTYTSGFKDVGHTQAIVFTIQEGLFETEFKSRSPIDRVKFLEYLTLLNKVYKREEFKNLRVIAIDYDLSPNNYDMEVYKHDNKCVITDPEERALQDKFEDRFKEFLTSMLNEQMKIVLISHIPVKNKYFVNVRKNGNKQRLHRAFDGTMSKEA
jgi:hypothetical protein